MGNGDDSDDSGDDCTFDECLDEVVREYFRSLSPTEFEEAVARDPHNRKLYQPEIEMQPIPKEIEKLRKQLPQAGQWLHNKKYANM